jgi:hypothetical protein
LSFREKVKNLRNIHKKILFPLLLILAFLQANKGHEEEGKVFLLKDVPFIEQKPDFCGEACIAAWLGRLGCPISQDQVFNLSGVDPHLGRGCVTSEMKTALEQLGFNPGPVWFKVDAKHPEKEMNTLWMALLDDLKKGIPSIVCMHYDDAPDTTEHFRLILGYDPSKDTVVYHEPAKSNGSYKSMDLRTFLKLWPLKYSGDEWTIVRMRLEGGAVPPVPEEKGFTSADFAQRVMQLKKRLPKGFSFLIQKPFIVTGDESREDLEQRGQDTVRWFTEQIQKKYFPRDPPLIYEIWLFRDNASYRKYTREVFHDDPDTPYGYCSSEHSALIMNIATGGGTLCHEIVHAFMPSNFPDCPSWFNEGLGSLYEQCGTNNGAVAGLTNWRLKGLKDEIRRASLPSFETLCGTSSSQFYNMRKGDNYAQARYLLYYLQEKGLLEKYYTDFRTNVKGDPTGYKTLQLVLSEKDMKSFQARWEKWVLTLRFP